MLLDSPEAQFGWTATDFTLQDPTGTAHRLRDHLTDQGLFIAFICNHCPYVQAIADRLSHDCAAMMADGIGVLAIMPNDYHAYPADRPDAMTEFAKSYGFTFPYLVDEDQAVAKAYGAVCTPDFFGFDGKGALRYRGRLDDQGRISNECRNPDALNAMRQIAKTGQVPEGQMPSMGCSIKWKIGHKH